MTREQLINKSPELFLNIIKEGIELCLYGMTDIKNIEDVEKYNEEIKRKIQLWETKNEEQLLELI